MATDNKTNSVYVESDQTNGSTTITSTTTVTSDNRQKLMEASLNALTSMTTKKTFLEKLTSRKFWVAFAGFICGIIGMFGVDDNIISTVSFGILGLGSIVAYIISEGKLDSTSMQNLISLVSQIIDRIDDLDSQNVVTSTVVGASEPANAVGLNDAILSNIANKDTTASTDAASTADVAQDSTADPEAAAEDGTFLI